MHILNIIGNPGNETRHRLAGKKGHTLLLDVIIQPGAHAMHDLMTGVLHDHPLEKCQDKISGDDAQENQNHQTEAMDIGLPNNL
jgi:hypothetical protein